jgi:hypothetical protein
MNITKVKIVQVYTSDKKKTGEEYKTKDGREFWRVGIKTDRHGQTWLSTNCFKADAPEMSLNKGDEIDIVVTEQNGFQNFKIPGRLDKLEARIEQLENAVYGSAAPEPQEQQEQIIDIPF